MFSNWYVSNAEVKVYSGFYSCKRFSSIRRKYEFVHRYFIDAQRKFFVKNVENRFVELRSNCASNWKKILTSSKSSDLFFGVSIQ